MAHQASKSKANTPIHHPAAAGLTGFPAIPALYLGRMDTLGFAEGPRQLLEVYPVQVPVNEKTRHPATAIQDKTRPPAQRPVGDRLLFHPKPPHSTQRSLIRQNKLSRLRDCRCM